MDQVVRAERTITDKVGHFTEAQFLSQLPKLKEQINARKGLASRS